MQLNLIIERREHRGRHAALCNGLSRINADVQFRFLEEDAALTPHPYPTKKPTPID
jgi:hypothetical protein